MPTHSIAKFLCLILAVFIINVTSGCAAMSMAHKVTPPKEYKETPIVIHKFKAYETYRQELYITYDNKYLYIFESPKTKGAKTESLNGKIISITIKPDFNGNIRGFMKIKSEKNPGTEENINNEIKINIAGQYISIPNQKESTELSISEKSEIIMYEVVTPNDIKILGIKSIAFGLGGLADTALLSSSLSVGWKIFGELWLGYVIGCTKKRNPSNSIC